MLMNSRFFSYQKKDRINWLTDLLVSPQQFFEKENKQADDAQSSWGLDMLLLRLIQSGSLEENPRNERMLREQWDEFITEMPNVGFTLEDVISNGWVRIVWDQWSIPREFFASRVNPDTQNHLVLFLKKLSASPYADERALNLPKLHEEMVKHKEIYSMMPNLEWFLEQELICKAGESYVLNTRHSFVNHFADRLLARLWEEQIAGPIQWDDRLSWWKEYFTLLFGGYQFINWLHEESKEKFLDAGVHRLLMEQDCIGWSEEGIRYAAQLYANYPDKMQVILQEPYIPSLRNDQKLDRMDWLMKLDENDAGRFLDTPRELLSTLFSYVLTHDGESKSRIQVLIEESTNRPFFYNSLTGNDNNYRAVPLLLLSEDHLLLGMHGLISYCSTYTNYKVFDEWKESFERLRMQEVWEEGLNFFTYTLLTMDKEKAVDCIIQLVEWLYADLREGGLQNSWKESKRKEQLNSILQKLAVLSFDKNESQLLLNIVLPEILMELQKTFRASLFPLRENLWPFALWIVEKIDDELFQLQDTIYLEFVEEMASYYEKSLRHSISSHEWVDLIEKEIESPAWLVIHRALKGESEMLWQRLLLPIDFERLAVPEKDVDHKKRRQYVGIVRTHIRFLAYLSIHETGEEVQEEIQRKLQLLITFFLTSPFDFFGTTYEEDILYGKRGADTPLIKLVGSAINLFNDKMREDILKEIGQKTNRIHLLSSIHNAMSRTADQKMIEYAIKGINTDESLDEVFSFVEVQRIVSELLNTENPELIPLANDIMARYKKIAEERNLIDWLEWEMREQLRGHYLTRDYKSIFDYKIPEKLKKSQSAQRAYQFYKGLSWLASEQEESLVRAVSTFRNLRSGNPLNVSYGINLLAGNVRLLEKIITQYGKESAETKRLVTELNVLFSDVDKIIPVEIDKHAMSLLTENRLFMFIITENWNDFWNTYLALDIDLQYRQTIGMYAVQVYMEQENWKDASILLNELLRRHGSLEEFERLERKIEEKENIVSYQTPSLHFLLRDWQSISLIKDAVKLLPTHEQAKAYFNSEHGSVKDVLLEEVILACKQVAKISSILIKYTYDLDKDKFIQGQEDHYNNILSAMLDQSIKSLSWSTSPQDPAGLTGNLMSTAGGIGERDIIVKDGNNQEITIIEALRLRHLETDSILKHFRKIFSYDSTNVNFYFMITWGFSKSPDRLWEKYRETVLTWKDGTFAVKEIGELPGKFNFHQIEWPYSFYSEHRSDDGRDIFVVHLYVDVLQEAKRQLVREIYG